MNTLRRLGAVLSMLFAASACSSDKSNEPTEGGDGVAPGGPISAGDTMLVQFDPGDTIASLNFTAASGQTLAFFVQPRLSYALLSVRDQATGSEMTSLQFGPDTVEANLTRVRSDRIEVTAGQTLDVRLLRPPHFPADAVRLWLYVVNRAPEHASATVTPGDTVTVETLENSADIDEFTVSANAGDTHIAYLGGSGMATGGLRLTATTTAEAALGAPLSTSPADPELESRSTGRFVVPGSDGYKITVEGVPVGVLNAAQLAGGYRFLTRKVNLGPEHGATVTPGDTLEGEAIDYVGDIDRFAVPVVPGRYYNIFFQKLATPQRAHLQLGYTAGAALRSITSDTLDPALVRRFTGIFKAGPSATLDVQISGLSDLSGLDRGPYRLFVYPIDTLPELVSPILAVGDSAVGETIEYPGDIDDFTIPDARDTVIVSIGQADPIPDVLSFLWGNPGHLSNGACFPAGGPLYGCTTSTFVTSSTGSSVRILSAADRTTGFVGPYKLLTRAVNSGPEHTAPALVPGTTVSDAIDFLGDMDVYSFSAPPGTALNLTLVGGGNSTGNSFQAWIVHPNGNLLNMLSTAGVPSGRFLLPWTGAYRVVARGEGLGVNPFEVGPYTLTLTQVPVLPESVAPGLALDDSVSEALDSPGDIDDFTYTGTPGTEVEAVMTLLLPAPIQIETWVPGDTAPMAHGKHGGSGRIVVPAGGTLRFRVAEGRQFGGFTQSEAFLDSGSYGLVLHQIHRAPEHAPSTVTLGVEVANELIDVVGDVDEFDFAGTQGQSLTIFLDNFASYDPLHVLAEVIDPVSGAVVGSVATTSQTPITSASFTLPATRTYKVRLQSEDPTVGVGSYRFALQ